MKKGRKYRKKEMERDWIEGLRKIVYRESPEAKKRAIERSGRLAEIKTKRVLEKLKKEGKIEGYLQSEKFSNKDRKRIDFTIYPIGMKPIFLDVKSHLYSDQVVSWKLEEISPEIWRCEEGIYIIEAGGPEENVQTVERKILRILEIEKQKMEQNRSFFILTCQSHFFLLLY